MGRVSSSLNTAQMSEMETLPPRGWETPVLLRLCIQFLLRLCMQSPECESGKSPLVSVTPLIPCLGKDIFAIKGHRLHSLKVDTLDT